MKKLFIPVIPVILFGAIYAYAQELPKTDAPAKPKFRINVIPQVRDTATDAASKIVEAQDVPKIDKTETPFIPLDIPETIPVPKVEPETPVVVAPVVPKIEPKPQVEPKVEEKVEVEPSPTEPRLVEYDNAPLQTALYSLAKQAKIDLVISEKISNAQPPMTVSIRLNSKAPLDAIKIIASSKGLLFDSVDGVYFLKGAEERASEPTESGSYTFSYATADKASGIIELVTSQLASAKVPQFDARTNTIYYREYRSNIPQFKAFLAHLDKPTRQVMIEARLVEVNANPKQSYGINWGGVLGSSSTPQTFSIGGSTVSDSRSSNNGTTTSVDYNGNKIPTVEVDKETGISRVIPPGTQGSSNTLTNDFAGTLKNFALNPSNLKALGGQYAILNAPQMSATLRLLNEDSDAEFIANPRVVTFNNQKATIEVTRAQPVPQLNFNEQTATAQFSGFQDKTFGNKLVVTPNINDKDFITLKVQPEISNKVGDAVFQFAGTSVTSPIIDKRTIDSNVIVKSGFTLAIGGLLQDETTKSRNKVPILGDIPGVGYLFQERLNSRTKRNLLIFITPTILDQGQGTGLENQIYGLKNSGEEFADDNGWRNNARGNVHILKPKNNQIFERYPNKGEIPPEPFNPNLKTSTSVKKK